MRERTAGRRIRTSNPCDSSMGHGIREFSNAECGFRYRHSDFKDNKHWIILSVERGL